MKKNNINFDDLTFTFTETRSMYVAKCRQDNDWETGELVPYGNISISPAATVLNYGQGLFEGMKAYKTESGRILLFRPEKNAEDRKSTR